MKAGRASTITDVGGGRILRLGGRPAHEARLMALARERGIPVPRVDEVRDDGLVLERIQGPTLGDALRRRPWRARRYVAVLVQLHDLLDLVALDGQSLVHFDLHPDNVLLSPSGPVLVDWTNAHAGDRDADVAMTWLILSTSAGPGGRLLARLFANRVGRGRIGRGLDRARGFRLADPNVTPVERARAANADPGH